MKNVPVIVVLTKAAQAAADRTAALFPGAERHVRRDRGLTGEVTFDHAADHLARLFKAGHPVIAFAAAGIVIRAVAPLLADKTADPPVLACDPDGRHIIPLLGGHHGANRLAVTIASALGGTAALTTAGEAALGIALDSPPAGFELVSLNGAKEFAARALSGTPVQVIADHGPAAWLSAARWQQGQGGLVLRVSAARDAGPQDLLYRPKLAALGVGCARGCSQEELIALAQQTLRIGNIAPEAVGCVVSVDVKADEAAIHALAAHFRVPARFFAPAALEALTPRLTTPSDIVFREVGCHGVSEAAALAAAGEAARLTVAKQKSARATAALALAERCLIPAAIGKPQGVLHIVGIGPGDKIWRSYDATARLTAATDWVGYKLYLGLLEDLAAGKTLHSSDLGEEEIRVRHALQLAAEGREVALIGSGDAGIYALATLVFEVLDRDNDPALNRVRIDIAPGISALQAAAARSGAPLGHDFCAISLSDLLTPRDTILCRVRAAAQADFVIAFYNPVSRRRRTLLNEARDLLLKHRPADTPVIVARNLGRAGEKIEFTALSTLSADAVDMLSIVIIGASTTRRIRRGTQNRIYTPRGYAKKRDAAAGQGR